MPVEIEAQLRRLGEGLDRDRRPVTPDEVMRGPAADRRPLAPVNVPLPQPGRAPRRRPVAALVAAVIVALVIVAIAVLRHEGAAPPAAPPPSQPAPTAPPTAPPTTPTLSAKARLLLDDSWTVIRADEQEPGYTEMTFQRAVDGRIIRLTWRHGPIEQWRGDEALVDLDTTVSVLGSSAQVLHIPDLIAQDANPPSATVAPDTRVAQFRILAAVGADVLDITVLGSDLADLQTLMDAWRVVDDDTWMAALPRSVVQPDERERATRDALVGVPTPPGFIAPTNGPDSRVRDHYQFSAEVTRAVACAWLDQWFTAQTTGDTAVATAAAEALDTSRQWPILLEMAPLGGWSSAVWEYADAVNGRGGIVTGKGPTAPTRDLAASGLGCTS
jgi:hypothetical protein